MNIKINDTSLISTIKGIISLIAWLNVTYSASVVLKVIYTCNFLHHKTRHPAYVIKYPIRNMKFYALLEAA